MCPPNPLISSYCKFSQAGAQKASETVRVVREATLDAFNRFERGYYPKQAHVFDVSRVNRENYLKALDSKGGENYFFVAEMNGRIVGAAIHIYQ